MRNLYYVGTIRGIPVRLHYSWIIAILLGIPTLFGAVLPTDAPDYSIWSYALLALLIVLLFCLSVLLHEGAHLFVAWLVRMRVGVLNLYPLGALTRAPNRFRSGWAELWVAAAGPIMSMALWWLFDRLAAAGVPGWLALVLVIASQLNLYLGLLNLLPGLPLDGGRVIHRCIYESLGSFDTATRITRRFGQIIAYGLMLYGISALIASRSWPLALGFILVGWLLREAGGSAYRRELVTRVFQQLTAVEIQTQPRQIVGPEQTLRQFAASLRGRLGNEATPVVANGVLLGMIDRQRLRDVPQGYWDERTVAEAMQPLDRLDTLAPTTPVSQIIPRFARQPADQPDTALPVVHEGRVLGLVRAESLLSLLDLEEEFGLFGQGQPASDTAYLRDTNRPERRPLAQRVS
jgi:Zn-dependent protease